MFKRKDLPRAAIEGVVLYLGASAAFFSVPFFIKWNDLSVSGGQQFGLILMFLWLGLGLVHFVTAVMNLASRPRRSAWLLLLLPIPISLAAFGLLGLFAY